MTVRPEARGKFYAMRALAVALGAFALAAFLMWPDSFQVRLLGLIGIVVGLWLVRRSNAYVWQVRGQAIVGPASAKMAGRVSALAWALTGSSLVACVVFYAAMHADAVHGGKEAWPAYALAAAVLAFAATSGYVAMKMFR